MFLSSIRAATDEKNEKLTRRKKQFSTVSNLQRFHRLLAHG